MVRSIFTYDWNERPSIVDVANNPWFLNNESCLQMPEYNLRPRYIGVKRLNDTDKNVCN